MFCFGVLVFFFVEGKNKFTTIYIQNAGSDFHLRSLTSYGWDQGRVRSLHQSLFATQGDGFLFVLKALRNTAELFTVVFQLRYHNLAFGARLSQRCAKKKSPVQSNHQEPAKDEFFSLHRTKCYFILFDHFQTNPIDISE